MMDAVYSMPDVREVLVEQGWFASGRNDVMFRLEDVNGMTGHGDGGGAGVQ